MTRIVLLLVALLMIGVAEPVDAARPTRYARAKMRGKTYTHRPFYKRYKGHKKSKQRFFLFGQKSGSRSTYKVGRHSTR